MPHLNLPAEAEWPAHLFRVTSSLTWRRTSSRFDFISPVQQLYSRELSLEDAFQTDVQFKDAVGRHLKTSHVIESGSAFHTPFISTTTSFRYALSVAELHYQRDGEEVTIAVIDTTLIEQRRPIWDAAEIAWLIQLGCFRSDFKDEFLVFGAIKASEQSLKVVKYLDLTYKLGSFLPAFLEKDNSRRARFSTFWKDIPKRFTEFKPSEATSAFELARAMSTSRMTIPLMVMVLFLEERRNSYGAACIEEVVRLVRSKVQTKHLDAYFRFILEASYGQASAMALPKTMRVYEYLDEQYHPRKGSASTEVKYVNKTLAALREKLHEVQTEKIKKRFNLSPTVLIVRRFTGGYIDKIVKSTDRPGDDFLELMQKHSGGGGLVYAVSQLKIEVQGCGVEPLARLHQLVKKAQSNAPCQDGDPLVEYWIRKFEEIRGKLRTASPGLHRGNVIVGVKRPIDEVEAPEQPATSRVRVETTQLNMQMTVTRSVGYRANDREEQAKGQRVPW